MTVFDLLPRRVAGLPPGQRLIREFPRFSDKPLRWAPEPGPIELTISVDGDQVDTLSADDLLAFELIDQVSDFHCVTTWSHQGLQWRGVRLADVVRAVLGDSPPPFAIAAAADGQHSIYTTEDLLYGDVLLATHLNGEPLDRKHGAPLRLVSPSQYGYKSAKHLIGLDFCSQAPRSTLGPKEHLRARVALEERHATLPNWLLRVPYRLTIIPTALAAERGLRNSAR